MTKGGNIACGGGLLLYFLVSILVGMVGGKDGWRSGRRFTLFINPFFRDLLSALAELVYDVGEEGGVIVGVVCRVGGCAAQVLVVGRGEAAWARRFG
jgi:hypothetical protein